MATFRKKPVTVEAVQWNGTNLGEVQHFAGGGVEIDHGILKVFTDSGPVLASFGDWIIKGTKNEIYPCKPEVFAEIYEAA